MSEMFMEMHTNQQSDTEISADLDDPLNNILRLQLKKPNAWKWELTTSRSSPKIAMPRVLLFNNKGNLLADANGQEEQIFREKPLDSNRKPEKRKKPKEQLQTYSNNLNEMRKAFQEFDCLRIAEAEELVAQKEEQQQNSSTFNSKTKATPPSTATSSSGPREKRKIRRTNTTGRTLIHSDSILERLSVFKDRLSSPEDSDGYIRPRYFLRTSKAGTLVIAEDSFNLKNRKPRRRRRPKKSSSTDSVHSTVNRNIDNCKILFSQKDRTDVLYESSTESKGEHKTSSLNNLSSKQPILNEDNFQTRNDKGLEISTSTTNGKQESS